MKKKISFILLVMITLCMAFSACGEEVIPITGNTTIDVITTTTKKVETTTRAMTTTAPIPKLNLPLKVTNNTLTTIYYINEDGNVCLRSDNSVVMRGVKSIYEKGGYYETQNRIVHYFIMNDDSLWGYGSGQFLGDNTGVDKKEINDSVKILDNVAEIHEYNDKLYAITKDKELYGWGYLSGDTIYAPKLILSDVVSFTEYAVVKSDGSLWYVTEQNTNLLNGSLTKIENLTAEKVFPFDTEYNHESSVLLTNGDLLEAVHNYSEGIVFNKLCSDVVDCDKSIGVFNVYKKDGSLWAMGENSQGGIGDGSKIPRDSFVKIADNVKKAYYFAYVTNDNELMTWTSDNPTPQLYSEDVVEFYTNYNGLSMTVEGDVMLKTDGSIVLLNNFYGNTDILAKNVMLPTTEIIE
jgi:hypothetical protein